MKLKAFLPIFLAAAIVGCSSDDESSTLPSNNNYFPLTTGNSWSYNNERTVEGETPTQSQETMSVADSTQENGSVYYDLNSDNTLDGGLATSVFSNGKLSKINGNLIYDGSYSISFAELGIDTLEIPIQAAVIYSNTASSGDELFHFSDSFQQEIDVQGQSIPLNINYTLSTHNLGFLNSFSAGGRDFAEVLKSDLLISVSVTTTLGPIDPALLAEQNVVSVTNYYANDIGLVFSDVMVNYEFEDLSNFGIPKIPTVHIESSQEIETYIIVSE